MKILLGKLQIALRKCNGNSRSINALWAAETWRCHRALDSSWWRISISARQLGPASLFCSFPSAEMQWINFLRILGQVVDHREYTITELENVNWDEKCRLIQCDPVTCARHFDYQISQFLTSFLYSKIAQSLGNISDWFYRVEYQQQGSPHIHMLIWLKEAPVFGVDDDDLVTDFINQISVNGQLIILHYGN